MTEKRYQIRTAAGGIALYNGTSATDALLKFVSGKAKAALLPEIVAIDKRTSEIEYEGTTYQAVEFQE